MFEIPTVKSKLTGAGVARNWPNNRGIYYNSNLSALAWINDEDHIRLISQEAGMLCYVMLCLCYD